jgi:secreted trypsin-like serine protease
MTSTKWARALIAGTALALIATGTASAADDVSTNVVGGTRVSTKDNPFAVFLVRPGKRTNFCGGSVVAPNKILTAAHCVETDGVPEDPATVQVVAGRDDEQSDAGVVAKVTKLVLHPQYDGIGFDFAVLTLDRKLPQKPIAMATAAQSGHHQVGTRPTVLGWGFTKTEGPSSQFLLQARVPVVEGKTCLDFYGDDDAGVPLYDDKVMICTLDRTGKKDACFGDSGGPFVGGGVLVGVVSFGPEQCASPDSPAVFAKVSTARSWVLSQF